MEKSTLGKTCIDSNKISMRTRSSRPDESSSGFLFPKRQSAEEKKEKESVGCFTVAAPEPRARTHLRAGLCTTKPTTAATQLVASCWRRAASTGECPAFVMNSGKFKLLDGSNTRTVQGDIRSNLPRYGSRFPVQNLVRGCVYVA